MAGPDQPVPADYSSEPIRMTGIIALFAAHKNAANLLLALMVIAGIYGLLKLNSQFLPDFGIDVVSVRIEWPGATAADVDSNIVQAVEPEVRFLDSVKRVKSSAYEGLANVSIEFEAGSDMQAALSDVEAAISRIRTFPEDSKTPDISRIVRYETLMRVVMSGPYPEASLKAYAKRLRDGLLERGIDKVDLIGTLDEEILVEVPSTVLRRLDLTLADIAGKIGETSQDLPSGDIGRGQRQIRSLGLLRTARDLEGVEVKALEDGRKIYLRDVAQVREGFDDDGVMARRRSLPAVELHVQRAVSTDALKSAKIAEAYLNEVTPTLPSNFTVERYDIATDLLQDRINLLIRNGGSGLIIVILVLMVFLKARVAFWVMIGIPASLMATFGVMLATGQTINMVSLFGLIMTIGIIVDDAIVVGEHADTRSQLGLSPLAASVSGAQRMAIPVLSAALTTVSAFLPLFVISNIIGQIISAIPLVVVAVLIASLVECFFVLPGHLRGAVGRNDPDSRNIAARYRNAFDSGFASLRDGPFRRLVVTAFNWRYATLAIAFGLFVLAVGLVAGGRVGFSFFPSPESDKIFANVEMVPGTPRAQTQAMLDEMDRALYTVAKNFEGESTDLVRMSVAKIGTSVGRSQGSSSGAPTDSIGGLIVELRTADKRDVRTQAFVDAWRAEIRPTAGTDNFTIREAIGGPPGRDVDVRLIGTDIAALKNAANEVQLLLKRYPGVSAIEDDLPYGKLETILEVSQRGRALRFDTSSVGRQVRNAIEGAIAKRFPRADEEVTVRVKLPDNELDTDLLDRLYLRAPSGAEVALAEVISRRPNQSFARISREDGGRQVAVTAKLDTGIISTVDALAAIQRDGLWDIARKYGVDVSFKGKSEEREETFADMRIGALIGLAGIYIILAWVFASYTRPVVVMAIIPMGFVGAVVGHWLLDYNMTILSMVALIGLAGIVVNNAIILVTTMEWRARTESLQDAIVGGACDRLRAIILTSATTIGGLTPLLFETSLQARFLIPMAVTIVFGLACAASLVLFVVPALMGVQDDLRRLLGRSSPYSTTAEA
jgi:multidrug efflux pump subunit AcrB